MGTSWVAVSINNITTRASREMTSRKKYQHFRGEVFAISDCIVDLAVSAYYIKVLLSVADFFIISTAQFCFQLYMI